MYDLEDIDVIGFVRDYSESLGYGRSDEDVEELVAFEDEIFETRYGNNLSDIVIILAGRYIRYTRLNSIGNNDPVFYLESIRFMNKVVTEIVSYEL